MTLKVVVVQRVLPHYRVRFFELLRSELRAKGVDLTVIAGQAEAREASKDDTGTLADAVHVRNRYLRFGRRALVWQPVLRHLKGADLVVVEQASRLLANYVLILQRLLGGRRKVAYWGHGRNLDRDRSSWLGETAKRALLRRPSWWFAYTEGTAAFLIEHGVSEAVITVVQNATDTRSVLARREALGADRRRHAREALGLGEGPVGLVLGSLYPPKRLGYVIEAVDLIRTHLPTFEVILIGDGPERELVDSASEARPWFHVLGALKGEAMVDAAVAADVCLNPGLVGLSILDSCALGLPMVTCELPYHSPEVDYLIHDFNGLRLPASTRPDEYARRVVGLLAEQGELAALSVGCSETVRAVTVEEMARRFAAGVAAALLT